MTAVAGRPGGSVRISKIKVCPGSLVSIYFVPDSAKVEGSSIIDEPGEG